MIELKEALKLTNYKDDDVIYLKRKNGETEIILVADTKKKYDIQRVQVVGIKPRFICEDYAGIEFEIKEVVR